MLAFPSMLFSAATQAGIPVPPDETMDDSTYDPNEFPQWHVLCVTQLGRPTTPGEHFQNAVSLAKIDIEVLKTMTWNQLADAGICPHDAP